MHAEIARLTGEGLFTDEEIGTTCCFATQDKVWVTGPAGEKWEVYTVLADSETFGTNPQLLAEGEAAEGGVCCGGNCRRRRGAPSGEDVGLLLSGIRATTPGAHHHTMVGPWSLVAWLDG